MDVTESGGTVRSTYRWHNGNVMTFGEDGEQIPELQGPVSDELQANIRARSTPETQWIGWGEDGPAIWPERRPVLRRPPLFSAEEEALRPFYDYNGFPVPPLPPDQDITQSQPPRSGDD